MFRMTADIKFEGLKPAKPSAVTWSRNIDNICDSATIILPGICRMVAKDVTYDRVPTGQQIKEGIKVEFACGYDGNNIKRFAGFVKRVNFKIPVEIDCEGYSYQLRKKTNITTTYTNVKMRKVLEDLVQGTDIVLSPDIPDITIPKIIFKQMTGIQVLEWFKEKMLMTVYFRFNELYVGLRYLNFTTGATVKHRLNWNVIKDGDLMFNADREFAQVNIRLEARNPNGTKQKGANKEVKPGDVKVKKIFAHLSAADMARIAEDQKQQLNKKGYTGKITAFLLPYAEPAMSTDIIDKTYQERNGKYFIESVEGRFDARGGRQIIGIGMHLNSSSNG